MVSIQSNRERGADLRSRTVVARHPGAFEVRDTLHTFGATYPRHHHDHASLFIVLSGQVSETAGSITTECPRGAMGFLPAGVEHRSVFGEGPVHTLDVTIDAAWLERCGMSGRVPRDAAYACEPAASATAHVLLAACRQPDAWRRLAVEELLVQALLRTIDGGLNAGGATRGADRSPAWVDDVVEHLHAVEDESIDLGTLAGRVGRNPAHLCRAFRASFGCSVFEYARMVRLERASVLLRTTDRPLCRVALETGFSDQAHFTRLFRAHTGLTPKVYRRGAR